MFIIENKTLYVGIDFCNEYSHMSYYDEALFEPTSVCEDAQETSYLIPTVLAARKEDQQWYIGKEALDLARTEKIQVLKNIIPKIIQNQTILYYDTMFTGDQILYKLFLKLFQLLQKNVPNMVIGMLAISVPDLNKELKNCILNALLKLGVNEERVQVISHQQSYVYYALSQKKELWQNDVGLFDFSENGLSFYQIYINRRTNPVTVGVEKKNFETDLSYDMRNQLDNNSEMQYVFENITKKVLHKKVISTIYVTGKGFKGDWANKILEGLCIGRRVFIGENLYSAGACYYARELGGFGNLSDYLYLSEEMVLVNISVKLYHNTQIEQYFLTKAGIMWYDVDESVEVIPEGETELEVEVYNVIDQTSAIHFLHIDKIDGRPDKATTLEIALKFLNSKVCVIQVKDKGFGEWFPTTNRIWEKEMHLG